MFELGKLLHKCALRSSTSNMATEKLCVMRQTKDVGKQKQEEQKEQEE